MGALTINVVRLNDQERLNVPRFKPADSIHNNLENLLAEFNGYVTNALLTTRNKNKILNQLMNLMELALPTSEYSAIMSTIILECVDYRELKAGLEKAGLWDQRLSELEASLEATRLDVLRT